MAMTNPYCEALGIEVPRLEDAMESREASTYALLIVALLEKGGSMTLAEVARRFDRAGVAPEGWALRSLKRCRPGRAPVYRDGDLYALDPHDDEVDLWVFRLGLRPPRVRPKPPARPEPEPLPGPEEPLTVAELEEAWQDASLYSWSVQRLALAVLDAHGRPMSPREVVDFLAAQTQWHGMSAEAPHFARRGSPIAVREDGRWALAPGREALLAAREAVRQRLAQVRRWAPMRPDPAAIEANLRAAEQMRAAHAAELAALRRVLVRAFPPDRPEAVVLLDVGERAVATFLGEEIAAARERLDAYDVIAAEDVRALLRGLGYEPGERRLAELGPPRKTKKLNRRGRTLKITTDLLVRGSCGIGRPFGDEARLREYLRRGQQAKLRRRLEADAKSLFALYQYGRLQGAVRLRWGFLDERIPAPWVHRDEPTLYALKRHAADLGARLEVVAGGAPGWSQPWSRAFLCSVQPEPGSHWLWLVDEAGWVVDDGEVQLARLVATVH
jgi:hypothetical protein